MSLADIVQLIRIYVAFLTPYLFTALKYEVFRFVHRRIYKVGNHPKNIIIVGGSFAGVSLAQKLVGSAPSGYRVILIERNSHFNYAFNFPRYSVFAHPGHERLAFIPYDGIAKGAPANIFEHVRGEVTNVDNTKVHIQGRESISYAYLVIATGSSSPPPAKLASFDRGPAIEELQRFQQRIIDAKEVVIVGGGAVGVELAADVKSWFPEKSVTLVHSRSQLLNRFGQRLHQHAFAKLQKLGIEIILGQRPEVLPAREDGRQTLRFKDKDICYDTVITCTGQAPNTSILSTTFPDAISATTRYISVSPTLQIMSGGKTISNVFAIGDVAQTNGPKMGRAAFFQSSVVRNNILHLIRGHAAKDTYIPRPEIEGALKLTLGRHDAVIYTVTSSGVEVLIETKISSDDLEAKTAWKMFGAKAEPVL